MDARELVDGLVAGEERAWQEFLHSYGRLIYAVVGRFAVKGIDRDDLFQETCLKALQSIHTLQSPDRLASWVYTIAYRLSVDALRRQRPEARLENPDALLDTETAGREPQEPLQRLERLEKIARLLDGLQMLDPRCRRLLTALYLEEPPPSYVAIGKREDMPVGSIGPTRARCLGKLKKVLADLSNGPSDTSA